MTAQIDWLDRRPAYTWQTRRATMRVSVQATDQLVASGLLSMLRDTPNIELVTEASSADIVVAVADSDLNTLLTTTTRLVLIADELRQADLWTAIEHGLIVLIPRTEVTKVRLLRAIADARECRGDLPAAQLGCMLQSLSRLQESTLGPRDLTLSGLSPRETEVLRLLAAGMDTSEMAETLLYSERTVKNILHGILTRLQLRNRAHAVAYALRHGLI